MLGGIAGLFCFLNGGEVCAIGLRRSLYPLIGIVKRVDCILIYNLYTVRI